jgi:hypothetical protein
VVVSAAALSAIKGFKVLGSVIMPDDEDISRTLSELAAAALLHQAGVDPVQQLLGDVIAPLAFSARKGTCRRQFFFFPVLSNTPDLVFSDDSLRPAWKWVKPGSPYRKKGFWEAELRDALEDGEWTSGRDLVVLVGGVSEETLRTIASSELGWKFTTLEGAERVSRNGGYV